MTWVAIVLAALLLGIPGLRMLSAGARHGREPELWLGLVFCGMAIGLPLRFVAVPEVAAGGADVYVTINAVAHSLLSLATGLLYLFIWRVFRRQSTWGMLAGLGGFTFCQVTLVAMLTLGGARQESAPVVALATLSRALVAPWLCIEATRFYLKMRRRVPLGLADPVVTNRFLLWAIWSGVFSVLPFFVVVLRAIRLASGGDAGYELLLDMLPLLRATMLVCVATAGTCIWLGFFPPTRYCAWLRNDATATA